MSFHAIGLILVWLGALVLVAVLQNRLRQGAWRAESFDTPPPVGRSLMVAAVAGMVLALAGAALTLWAGR